MSPSRRIVQIKKFQAFNNASGIANRSSGLLECCRAGQNEEHDLKSHDLSNTPILHYSRILRYTSSLSAAPISLIREHVEIGYLQI